MRFAVSGASGLLGTTLRHHLAAQGHDVLRLVRGKPADSDEVMWSPSTQQLDGSSLVDTEVLVHLAGEPVIGARWTAAKKRRVRESRRSGTTLIAAEKTGRRARLLELDAAYCDTIIRRWQSLTGKHARCAETGTRFETVEAARKSETQISTSGEEEPAR